MNTQSSHDLMQLTILGSARLGHHSDQMSQRPKACYFSRMQHKNSFLHVKTLR